jgi:hypothetical protein
MKELLTKTFWRDVKRTFDEARADTIQKSGNSHTAVPAELKTDVKPAQVPSPPEEPQALKPSVESMREKDV